MNHLNFQLESDCLQTGANEQSEQHRFWKHHSCSVLPHFTNKPSKDWGHLWGKDQYCSRELIITYLHQRLQKVLCVFLLVLFSVPQNRGKNTASANTLHFFLEETFITYWLQKMHVTTFWYLFFTKTEGNVLKRFGNGAKSKLFPFLHFNGSFSFFATSRTVPEAYP